MPPLAPELIGNEPVRRYLRLLVDRAAAPGSFLFVGPASLGKRLTALAFAHALQCTSAPVRAPCGRCGSCRAWAKGIHPDTLVVEQRPDRTAILLEQIRPSQDSDVPPEETIHHRLHLRPLLGRRQVVILPEADQLHGAAANALLKTLEEPRADTVLILVATNTENLPRTVVSRCTPVQFSRVPAATINQALKRQGVTDAQRRKTIAALADGSPGRAFRLVADPEALLGELDRAEALIQHLRDCRRTPFGLGNALFAKPGSGTQETIRPTIELLQRILSDCLQAALGSPEHYQLPRFRTAIESLAAQIGLPGVQHAAADTLRLIERVAGNVSPKTAVDAFTNRFATYG